MCPVMCTCVHPNGHKLSNRKTGVYLFFHRATHIRACASPLPTHVYVQQYVRRMYRYGVPYIISSKISNIQTDKLSQNVQFSEYEICVGIFASLRFYFYIFQGTFVNKNIDKIATIV